MFGVIMSQKKNRTKKKGGFIRSIYNYFKNKNIQKINDNYYKEHQEKINTFKNIELKKLDFGNASLYDFLKNDNNEYSNSIILQTTKSNFFVLDQETINNIKDRCNNVTTGVPEIPIFNLHKSHIGIEWFFSDFKIIFRF